MTRIMHGAGIGVTHGAGVGLSEFPSDLADAGTAGSAAAFSVQTSDASALVTLASSIRGSDAPPLCMRVLVAVSVTAWAGVSTAAAGTARPAHVRHPSRRFSRLQKEIAGRDDAERKKAIHRRSRFFCTHELLGANCPIQKAAPRTLSGYVTKIGTEPQVAPFRAAILRGSADLVHLEFQRGHGVRNRGGAVARRLMESPIPPASRSRRPRIQLAPTPQVDGALNGTADIPWGYGWG
jgi:hypothetical protein